jgi:cobalt-zinc-cadmium efflux system protein
MEVASAHLTIGPDCDQSAVLAAARSLLASEYQLEHATLQIESGSSAESCRELHW